ncbi:hypothetical protein HPL003_02270 [Paenibacillus terrae HPL-003]|uniref:Transposase n=1 Tax=Paenibacillus terrae (strain HPL-003) TaxID=985665 RepID=G7VZJ3_PAETH|nr:hypothetical protein HPL003_02270 [Paenibacillus terrae HPL-003]
MHYVDVARKFTVYKLYLFLAEAAFQQWKEFRGWGAADDA